MKKALSSLIALVILITITCAFAYATEFENGVFIASSYQYWSSMFGATDISQDIDIQDVPDGNGEKRLFTDDLVIDFYSTIPDIIFDTKQVVLFASNHTKGSSAYAKSRILGLFAALEYGKPKDFSSTEIDDAYTVAKEAYDDYSLAMVSNLEKLYSGEFVLFRMNDYGRYYVVYLENAGFCIMVE